MGRKDFQKGMEEGTKPFEEKFEQQADAINRVSNKIEDGIKKIDGVVEEVIDGLSSIEKKIEIAADEEKTFAELKIRLLAPIACHGKLNFERCVIIYNSKKLGENNIICSNGTITLSNCTVIDKNEEQDEDNSNDYFLYNENDSNLICDNTLFYNCERFAFHFNTKITDCVFKYTDLPINPHGVLVASNAGKSEIRGCLFENTNLEWVEEPKTDRKKPHRLYMFCDEKKRWDDVYFWSNTIGLLRNFNFVSKCTFKNLCACVEIFNKVEYCHFVNCVNILRDDYVNSNEPAGEVLDCLFEFSSNAINTVNLVSNCQFIGCRQEILRFHENRRSCNAPVRIENCNFYNSSGTCFENVLDYHGLIQITGHHKYFVSDCVFDGINTETNIDKYNPHILDIYWDGSSSVINVTVENCSFKNCFGINEKEPICMGQEMIPAGLGFFTGMPKYKEQLVRFTEIINCKGLENINKEGKEAKEIPIQMKAKDGTAIGSSIEADDVGIGGFDPAKIAVRSLSRK
jgi:hypothetical protein